MLWKYFRSILKSHISISIHLIKNNKYTICNMNISGCKTFHWVNKDGFKPFNSKYMTMKAQKLSPM